VRVQAVLPGSPAEKAGIRPGDVITAVDGRPLAGLRALSEVLKAHRPGDEIAVTVVRGATPRTLRAVLGER
jgi:Trypsin-like serine proteases, typically periplasmic, contain C-terminal PDZ domain